MRVLAFAHDRCGLSSLVVEDEPMGLFCVVGPAGQWRIPGRGDPRWRGLWLLHASVGKQDFRWVVQPDLDEAGYPRSAVRMEPERLPEFATWLDGSLRRGIGLTAPGSAGCVRMLEGRVGEEWSAFLNGRPSRLWDSTWAEPEVLDQEDGTTTTPTTAPTTLLELTVEAVVSAQRRRLWDWVICYHIREWEHRHAQEYRNQGFILLAGPFAWYHLHDICERVMARALRSLQRSKAKLLRPGNHAAQWRFSQHLICGMLYPECEAEFLALAHELSVRGIPIYEEEKAPRRLIRHVPARLVSDAAEEATRECAKRIIQVEEGLGSYFVWSAQAQIGRERCDRLRGMLEAAE